MQIEERWRDLLYRYPQDEEKQKRIWGTMEKLKKSLHLGRNPEVLSRYDRIPEELKRDWVNLIYTNNDHFDGKVLEKLIVLLDNPTLAIPSRERSKKNLTVRCAKAMGYQKHRQLFLRIRYSEREKLAQWGYRFQVFRSRLLMPI